VALDDATTAFLAQMAESGRTPLHEMTPMEARGLGVAAEINRVTGGATGGPVATGTTAAR
jgi:hypothetical protein